MYDKTDVKQTHCVCYSLGAPPNRPKADELVALTPFSLAPHDAKGRSVFIATGRHPQNGDGPILKEAKRVYDYGK